MPTPSSRLESADVADQRPRLWGVFERGVTIISTLLLALIVAASMMLLASGAGVWAKRRLLPGDGTGAGSDTLGFKARYEAGQLVLSWDLGAEAIKTADRAVLSITDGDRREDVELDLRVLRTKRLTYSAVSNDVSFQLRVDHANGRVSESVRVLTPGAAHQSAPSPSPRNGAGSGS